MEDKDFPGWSTEKGIATIILMPRLPSKADWNEAYVTSDNVKWSFFPLGIGSKGGIPFTHPETGETVRLIRI